ARSEPAHRVRPSNAAARRALGRRGRHPGLGSRPRRVRSNDHVRRQPARRDADQPARRIPLPGDRSRRGGAPERTHAGDLAGGAARPPRPLAGPALDQVLQADLAATAGDLEIRATFTVPPGETLAILGPNAAGKTTLLRALAGLLRPRGRVSLGDQVLDDSEARVHVDPELRKTGFVFQDHLLFPHLSALDNVAFGLRARGANRREAGAQAREWLARLGL